MGRRNNTRTRKVTDCDPVGIREIAERLGYRQSTVAQWNWRSSQGRLEVPLPEPRWVVSGHSAWEWADIEAWAEKTGRL